ncbi:GDNF-inducible zinc finger protein 1-like [Cloeon dipterum]|uniref:GDNF-inducible zinc finger protein 1-like n=1 Tax=Cloeon dipterum TaxID=197152 RepID=UPI00321F9E7B
MAFSMFHVTPLCRLCACPTADGAVRAVQVDREKLRIFAKNFLRSNSSETVPMDKVEDDDLICYFCIWQTEFLARMNNLDESLAWWPRNLELDRVSEELRKHFYEGHANQCWVPLEKIQLPSRVADEEINKAETEKKMKKCCLCGEKVHYRQLTKHIHTQHKDAIRCDNNNCKTYFRNVAEKDRHVWEVHEKPQKEKKINCPVCRKEIVRVNYRKHIGNQHPDFAVRCRFFACCAYFKSETEMAEHYYSAHGKELEKRKFECAHCGHRNALKKTLKIHIAKTHFPRNFKCKQCPKMFSSQLLVTSHTKKLHTFHVCQLCQTSVTYGIKDRHRVIRECRRCEKQFECGGLLKVHLKTCMEYDRFECDKCSATYTAKNKLDSHKMKKH